MVVLGLVCVLEEQEQKGPVVLEELGLVFGMEVLLLLALVEVFVVESQLLWFFAGLCTVGGFGAGGPLSTIFWFDDLV